MSTLDEITKEKQRISEALARADAQREKLSGQLRELEATERVVARYSKGTEARKTALGNTSTTAEVETRMNQMGKDGWELVATLPSTTGATSNLLIFTAGRLVRSGPPIVAAGETALVAPFADPVPQALTRTDSHCRVSRDTAGICSCRLAA